MLLELVNPPLPVPSSICASNRILLLFGSFSSVRTQQEIPSNLLLPLLAYQLIRAIPALDSIISPKIQSDPLIFNESLETQFNSLIFKSLQQLHKESPLQKAIVLLADGVDECSGDENQVNFIHSISQFVAEKSVPLIVIFASRTDLNSKWLLMNLNLMAFFRN